MYPLYIFGLVLLLLKIAYQDRKYRLISDYDILAGLVWTWIFQYIHGNLLDSFLGALLNGSCYYVWYLCVQHFYQKNGFGAGDVTLSCLIGAIVGLSGTFLAQILTSIIIGFFIILSLILKRQTLKDPIPLAPYYVTATFFYLFFYS